LAKFQSPRAINRPKIIGDVICNGEVVIEQSHSSISKVIEEGCICNDAEITPDGLHGQPTEGALIAVAWKVTNYF
jgi:Ca2+-transporting ATPase